MLNLPCNGGHLALQEKKMGKNPKRLEISANQKAIICPTVQSEI